MAKAKEEDKEMAKAKEEAKVLEPEEAEEEMAEVGAVMIQKGQPVKMWECPFCGHIEYTSIYETSSPFCPACVSSGKVYSSKEKKDYYEVKEIRF